MANGKSQQNITQSKKDLIKDIINKKPRKKFLTTNQEEYYNILLNHEITFCTGPAGTGKSHIAMKAAIDLIFDDASPYEKIIIVRPAVESTSKTIGFLPGDVREKMDPYIYASYYLLKKIIGGENTTQLEKNGIIEIMSISFMRGINVDNSILILEESQNSTIDEMKLILTRIGFNSKFFITGDISQSDLDSKINGLSDGFERLSDINEIGFFKFNYKDIVRNPIITKILNKYD